MPDLIRRSALDRLDLSDVSSGARLPPVSPGEVLRIEFMAPRALSARALARSLDVPANRVTEILHGTRAITVETALRLAAYFGTSAEFWLHLQAAHDLERARAHAARPRAEAAVG